MGEEERLNEIIKKQDELLAIYREREATYEAMVKLYEDRLILADRCIKQADDITRITQRFVNVLTRGGCQ